MGFFDSKVGKKVLAYAYGWGAAVVIAGALFKLMHWPWAGGMLTLGMSVEAAIFFISAFEPLPVEYHWENVFPQLTGTDGAHAPVVPQMASTQAVQQTHSAPSANFNLDIDKSVTDDLQSGIKKFSDSLGKLSSFSTVIDASTELAGNMHKVSGSMVSISESTHMLADSYQKNVSTLQRFNEQSTASLDQMRSGYEFYRAQLETLGRTMGAVNSSYELYLQDAKKVQGDYATLHGEMGHLLTNVHTSIKETSSFTSNMSQLNANIGQLNGVYGNMLTSVNSVINK